MLSRVTRTAEQDNVAMRVLSELDIAQANRETGQSVPETGGNVVAIPTSARQCGRRARCEKSLAQIEMPSLIGQQ